MKSAPSTADVAALEWQVTLWSGEVTPEERDAFDRWRAARPEHERAWQQVRQMGERLHAAPDAVASSVLRQRTPRTGGSATRRKVLGGLGLLVATGGLAGLTMDTPPWRTAFADLRTGAGERRHVALPDGTRVAMNSGTAADVQFDTHQRRLRLHEGELLITTAHDAHATPRPFVVETREGRIQALGTRFSVRRTAEEAIAQVFEGALDITPHGTPGQTLRLAAGHQARFSTHRVDGPHAADPLSTAWERGLLVVQRWRLADVIAELSRHRGGVLRCDPAVADLVVSGVYRLDDTDAVLVALAGALPIQVRQASRYWVTVAAR